MDCIFCKIASGEIPAKLLYEDDKVVAFPDAHPAAPTHVLIVPKQHIQSLAHITDDQIPLAGHMIKVANQIARETGVADKGYRLVVNTGKESGQVVGHLHMHLLAGRPLADGMG